MTAFNHMTADLKTSRTELDVRRRDLEIVLANIAAGVVSADPRGRVTTVNRAAADHARASMRRRPSAGR